MSSYKYNPFTGKLDRVGPSIVNDVDLLEMKRKTLTPYELVSYLADGDTYTTPILTAGERTKILISTTPKFVTGFAIVDLGSGRQTVITA